MQIKEQKLHGNVLVLQQYSMRDKSTGQYKFLMDGNFNVLLNKIYNCLNEIDRVIVTIPDDVAEQDIAEFELRNHMLFDNKITLIGIEYGANAAANRTLFNDSFHGYSSIVGKALDECELPLDNKLDIIVSEFATSKERFQDLKRARLIQYVWPMTAIHTDDLAKPHGEYFHTAEFDISRQTNSEIYYLSDNQLEFAITNWEEHDGFANMYRSKRILNPHYVKAVAYASVLHTSPEVIDILDQAMFAVDKKILFFPMRIEDSRYGFNEAVKIAREGGYQMVITNPTNIDVQAHIDKGNKENGTTNYATVVKSTNLWSLAENETSLKPNDIVEIGEVDKREEYLYMLASMDSSAIIYHHDEGIHMSTMEQIILTSAGVFCRNISKATLYSYIA